MESGFHKRNAILIAIVCFVCMLIGSFYDYQISSAVFNTDSWFGILGAAYGQMPVSLGLILSSVLLFSIMEKRMCIKSVLQGIACGSVVQERISLRPVRANLPEKDDSAAQSFTTK